MIYRTKMNVRGHQFSGHEFTYLRDIHFFFGNAMWIAVILLMWQQYIASMYIRSKLWPVHVLETNIRV